MPDVLWSLREGQSEDAFDSDVRDITNFLDYVGEPAKLIRTDLGKKSSVLPCYFICTDLPPKERILERREVRHMAQKRLIF